MNKVLFKETQQFRQWWWIVLILASTVPVMVTTIYTLYQQTVRGIQVGDSPAPNGVMIFLPFFLGLMIWFFFLMKLEVWIDQDGIHYKFFPMIYKNRIISKEEIQRYEIRKYKPILEYGGWGIKGSFLSKKGKAFNVSGNIGLQLFLTNGKKVLFGTQRSQAIIYAMDEMMKSKTGNIKYQ
ncbi:MAG: hypothetical protein K0M40_15815 [Prolixibacteraceae bacterium]|nr:hypothetical protein [Prolixibacteraceae bacterium]